jgi:hypothetical protein
LIKRLTIGHHRLTLTFARIGKVIGVNSNLENGRHILMWDFDDVPLDVVADSLRRVQSRYLLSDIHICRTKEPHNYIAYCFSSQEWRTACEIVASTGNVDWQFFRFGVYRGHFTLRVTPKSDRRIVFATSIDGHSLPDCKPEDLKSWVRYETLSWR